MKKKATKILEFIRSQPKWRIIGAAVVLAAALAWFFHGGSAMEKNAPTFAARRGPLDITVLEGGSLKALESQEIKCEVRVGYQGTKILKIVEEGYFVTDDDVRTNKVLCELDSSDLQKQIVQQEIEYQSALASLADAEQNFQIQLGENGSDIKAAEQKSRFARMDFEKYLGDSVAEKVIAQTGLDRIVAEVCSNAAAAKTMTGAAPSGGRERAPATPANTNTIKLVAAAETIVPTGGAHGATAPAARAGAVTGTNSGAADPPGAADDPPADDEKPLLEIPDTILDFTRYANLDALGDGEAKQKLRKLDDDLQVAQKELGQAETALDGTRRLFDKGFVPKTEITRDEISYESAVLKVKSAETDRALFLKYEFPRTAEEDLSKYSESVREMDKAYHVAISKLAQARAKLNSAKGQYQVQLRQHNDLQDQHSKCTLVAQKSGLVVYGGNQDDNFYGNQEPIREGATVRERQSIITIPDLTRMSVNVKIHESYIKKIKKGQKARITVDAFPDQPLTGEITKVGVLPDSQNRWLNPDLKVYLTTITIDGTNNWLKPGMSAKVEILVNHLDGVIYVPVQAIAPDNGKQFCYVARGFKSERREVAVGEFTDEFIEIKNGLKEGERVLLSPPENIGTDGAQAEEKPAPIAPKPAKAPDKA